MKNKIDDTFLPTDSIMLNMLDKGLIELNQINEWYGTTSSGKTVFALSAIEKANEQGLNTLYYDCHKKNNSDKLKLRNIKLGDPSETLEEMFSNIYESINQGFNFIVIDDFGTLPTEKELHNLNLNDSNEEYRESVIRHGLRVINSARQNKKVTLLFICSLRKKIGVILGNSFGSTGESPLRLIAKNVVRFSRGEREKYRDKYFYNEIDGCLDSFCWESKVKWEKGQVYNNDRHSAYVFEMNKDVVCKIWDLFYTATYIGAIDKRAECYWIVVSPDGYYGMYDQPLESKKDLLKKLKENSEFEIIEKNIWEIFHHRKYGGYEGEVLVNEAWDLDYQRRLKEKELA